VSSTFPGAWRMIAVGASWLGEEVSSLLQTLLGLAACPSLADARGATGSAADRFLEADGGKSGWFGVLILPESAGLESL